MNLHLSYFTSAKRLCFDHQVQNFLCRGPHRAYELICINASRVPPCLGNSANEQVWLGEAPGIHANEAHMHRYRDHLVKFRQSCFTLIE